MPPHKRRPGPLQDLPLALFTPFETPLHPANPFKSSAKRSRSPSVIASPISPAKRRILHDESFFSMPLSPKSPGKEKRAESIALGSLSPRRLDFGRVAPVDMRTPVEQERHLSPPATPRPQRIVGPTNKLAPSPEFVVSPPSTKRRVRSQIDPVNVPLYPTSPIRIPRELPLLSDRQSTHYPGFDIHVDTHIVLPTPHVVEHDGMDGTIDYEEAKENQPPKKKVKTITLEAPKLLKRESSSSGSRNEEEGPAARLRTAQLASPRVPRSPATPRIGLMAPPSYTPGRSPRKADIAERKKMMEEEVDDVEDAI